MIMISMLLLVIMFGVLWLFGAIALADYVAGKIVNGDSLTSGYDFYYFLLAPIFLLLPPALLLLIL